MGITGGYLRDSTGVQRAPPGSHPLLAARPPSPPLDHRNPFFFYRERLELEECRYLQLRIRLTSSDRFFLSLLRNYFGDFAVKEMYFFIPCLVTKNNKCIGNITFSE